MSHPFPAPAFAAARPKARGAVPALVLGIVAVGGCFILVVPVFLAPLAWYHGAAGVRRVDREPHLWSGRGEAQAGQVLGMIGTALMVGLLGMLLLATVGVAFVSGYDAGYGG
jgi:hypothetical protein